MPRFSDAVHRGGRAALSCLGSRRGWTVAALVCLTATGILHADRTPETAPDTPIAPATDVEISPSSTALGRVLGDFDLDAKADVSIYHPASGLWFVSRSSDGATYSLGFGGSAYVPVAGDYDGDKKADIAVYTDGLWYIRNSSDGTTTSPGYGGAPNDNAAVAAYLTSRNTLVNAPTATVTNGITSGDPGAGGFLGGGACQQPVFP